MRPITRLLLATVLGASLAACAVGAGPTAAPAMPEPSASAAPPGEAPSDGAPIPVEPGGGIGDSLRVDPEPGQQNVVPIPLERIEAETSGRTVTLTLHWSSGVAPCAVLDHVLVDVGAGEVAITIREGTSDPEAICVLMLQAKHTVVTLELEPGTWVIRDMQGGAAPVEVTIA